MKYEMIFGDQSLFDNASDGAVLAIKDTTSGRIHFFTNDGWIKSGLKYERHIGTNDNGIAMRRIIKDKVDDENELENLYWEFDSQRSKKITDERLLFKGKLRYYASIASVDKNTKEPNRWTWEDKKAGRLPEVGTKAMQCHEYCTVDILSVHHGYIVVCNSNIDDSRPVSFEIEKFIELFNPIETPAEKAQREEDEFVKSEMKDTTLSIEWACIYERGVRDAYRKLKGGE